VSGAMERTQLLKKVREMIRAEFAFTAKHWYCQYEKCVCDGYVKALEERILFSLREKKK